MKYVFITLVLTSPIISAQWQDAISGNAILDSLHQEVSKSDTIEVLGPFEITLKKGNRYNITIVGESNLIPHIEFDVNKTNSFCEHLTTSDFTAKQEIQYKLL